MITSMAASLRGPPAPLMHVAFLQCQHLLLMQSAPLLRGDHLGQLKVAVLNLGIDEF